MGSFWITANSPGEIAGWLRPVAARLKRRRPDLAIKVVLLPCTFASGHEAEVARQVEAVDEVMPLAGVPRGERPEGLLHLGGDLMYAAFLARTHGMPAWGYQWARPQWDRHMTGYMVKTEDDRARLLKQKIAAQKIHVVGDLVSDAVLDQMDGEPAEASNQPRTLLFLPGSRQREAELLLPFFLKVASGISRTWPDLKFEAMLSPFLAPLAPRLVPHRKVHGLTGTVAGDILTADDGTHIRLRPYSMEALADADVVVSIPGTKTAEAAVLGRPMVVILPLNAPEEIPSFGLVGLLDYLPGVGKLIKGFFLPRLVDRIGFLAQPNILAGREIVPEMKGVLTAEAVGERVLHLLAEPSQLTRMAVDLRTLYQTFRGAGDRLVDAVLEDIAAPPQPVG